MKGLFVKLYGGCMRPILKDEDIIFVLPYKKIKLGDIVLYRTEYGNFLHRVIKISSEKITVCDDAGIASPLEISLDQVIGVYPTIFSGILGLLYHFFIRNVFIVCRFIKNLFFNYVL